MGNTPPGSWANSRSFSFEMSPSLVFYQNHLVGNVARNIAKAGIAPPRLEGYNWNRGGRAVQRTWNFSWCRLHAAFIIVAGAYVQ